MPWFCGRRLPTVKMPVLSKLTYKFSEVATKITMEFLGGNLKILF